MTKIITNVTKINNHWHGKDGLPIATLGAIIIYNNEKYFVSLDNNNDDERFTHFVNEENIEDEWTIGNTLFEKFPVEDIDVDWYQYYVKNESDSKPYGIKCINEKLR